MVKFSFQHENTECLQYINCWFESRYISNLLFNFSPPCFKATKDLENYDKERHEDFKKYEMTKEHDRQEHLKTLDEEERRKEEEHYEEMKKKHADHPKVNHPVSLTQASNKVPSTYLSSLCFFMFRLKSSWCGPCA